MRVLARGLGGVDRVAVPLVDAHKGEVFAAAYRSGPSGPMVEVVPPHHGLPALIGAASAG